MIFVVRHGERADQMFNRNDNDIELKFDPPISDLGKKQSYAVGLEIQALVSEGFEKGLINTANPQYVIISSPFIRCLQTAYHLSKSLPSQSVYNETIFYEEGIGEFMGVDLFDDDTLNHLYIRQKSEKDIKKLVPYTLREGFEKIQEHIVRPKYPENAGTAFERIQTCYSRILEHFMNELNKKGDKVLILVTHAFGVSTVLQIHNPLFYNDTGTEYTIFNQIIYDKSAKGKGKVLIKLYSKHILSIAKPKL